MEERTVDIPATTDNQVETPSTEQPKTFTQQELDVIIRDRLAKQKEQLHKNLGFDNIDNLKKTLKDYETTKTEYEQTKAELETYKLEKSQRELKETVLELGGDKEFVDYVLDKVSKEGDIKENIKSYLEANPKFKAEYFVKHNSNLPLGGGGQKDPSQMTMAEYAEWRKNLK